MIAVKDRQPLRIQQPVCREGVERPFEQCSVPPVEQITGDRQVLG